jgi:hypothetical protein
MVKTFVREAPEQLIDRLTIALEEITDRFEDALLSVHATRPDRQTIRIARKLVTQAAIWRAKGGE